MASDEGLRVKKSKFQSRKLKLKFLNGQKKRGLEKKRSSKRKSYKQAFKRSSAKKKKKS